MSRLQFRIAGILVGATTLVVVLTTLAAIFALTFPNPQRMLGPVTSQIRAISLFAMSGASALQLLTDEEVDRLGRDHPELAQVINDRLQMDGIAANVRVLDDPASRSQVAVAKIGGRNVAIEFPPNMQPPIDLLVILGLWMGVVVAGVVGISLVMAYRVTRPFALLEQAVATVGPDGVLPRVPEEGSREVAETAAVLNRLSDRLRTAMESRMRLVAAAGHDFRTPLTRMRLRAEFLDDEERASWLTDVDELERIADSAIRLVSEEVSDRPAEPTALDRLLAEEVESLASQGHALKAGRLDPVTLLVPPLAMRRALRNLLINAATHGRGGRVELLSTGDAVVLRISDTGPGIPEDMLARVFEPFFRAEPGRTQTVPGAGLGLAIAREIIERAGGQLVIRNRAEGGLIQELTFARTGSSPAG